MQLTSIADRAAALMQRFETAHHEAASDPAGVLMIATSHHGPTEELVRVHHEADALATEFRGAHVGVIDNDGVARIQHVRRGDIEQLGMQLSPDHRVDDWAHPAAMQLWTGLAELHAAAAASTPAERVAALAADTHRVLDRARTTLEGARPPHAFDVTVGHRYDALRGTAYRANEAADIARSVAELGTEYRSGASVEAARAAVGNLGAEPVWQSGRIFHTVHQAVAHELATVRDLDAQLAAAYAHA